MPGPQDPKSQPPHSDRSGTDHGGESAYYSSLGVSSLKADVHQAASILPPSLIPGTFCRVVDDALHDDPDYCVVSHADGAGTKSILAYLHYRLHNDVSVFHGIAEDAIVMNLDDMLCVGVTDHFAITSIINRNAKRIDGTIVEALIEGSVRFAERMNEADISVRLCGGETADMGDVVSTLIVDAVATSRVKRDRLVLNQTTPGSAIVGLASDGPAANYELPGWNSGIGSNGLTAARHALFTKSVGLQYPETVGADQDSLLTYAGPYEPQDLLPGATQTTILDALISPTRTFAPVIRAVLDEHRGEISALIHVSGGGHTKCLRFGQGIRYVKDLGEDLPPLFAAIADSGRLPMREMARIFNLGWRMEIVCSNLIVDDVIAICQAKGVRARLLGHTESSFSPTVNEVDLTVCGESVHYEGQL